MLLGGCWGPPTGSAIGCAGGRGAAGDTAAAAGLDRATAATAAATDPPPPPLFPCSSFFLLFSFPAGPRPLSLTAASILRYQGAREAEGGPDRWCGLWARGLPSRSWNRGRGRGTVVGGRKREETGSLTAAASARRLPPPPLRLPPSRLSSSRAHSWHLGLGLAQLAGSGRLGAGVLGLAPEERAQTPGTSWAPPLPRPRPNPRAWVAGGGAKRADHRGGPGRGSVRVNVGIGFVVTYKVILETPAWWQLLTFLFIFSVTLLPSPIFSFHLFFVFYSKGMTSWHRRENRVQAQKLFPHHHLLKN
nr:uncharacterized LOC128031834 homolog isoform X1 [Pan troglodytes]